MVAQDLQLLGRSAPFTWSAPLTTPVPTQSGSSLVTRDPSNLILTTAEVRPGFYLDENVAVTIGWKRLWRAYSPSVEGYWWFSLHVYKFSSSLNAQSYVRAEECEWAGDPGDLVPTVQISLPLAPIGDLHRACQYDFSDAGRVRTLVFSTRNLVVWVQINPGSASNPNTLVAMETLGWTQIGRIERLQPR